MYICNLKDKKFGALTPISYCKQNNVFGWLCKCDCGNNVFRSRAVLQEGAKNNIFATCGCSHRTIDGKEQTIVGKKFGKLYVKSFNPDDCTYKCISNNKEIILSSKLLLARIYTYLKNYKKRLNQQLFLSEYNCKTQEEFNAKSIRLHHIIYLMEKRCYDKSYENYQYYGGRGITVCEEWRTNHKSFVLWSLKNGYYSSLQIDRIDGNKEYSPDNCRWVTRTENMNNRRNCVLYNYNGEQKTLAQICRENNMNYKYSHYLITKKNYTIEDCVKKLSKNK